MLAVPVASRHVDTVGNPVSAIVMLLLLIVLIEGQRVRVCIDNDPQVDSKTLECRLIDRTSAED